MQLGSSLFLLSCDDSLSGDSAQETPTHATNVIKNEMDHARTQAQIPSSLGYQNRS